MGSYLLQKVAAVKIFIPVIYLVGLAGLLMPASHRYFCQLTPLTLLLTTLLLALYHPGRFTRKTLAVFGAIYLLGFAIEVAGVKSGILFGEYRYKDCLGYKLFDTPLIIGLNWLTLVYLSSSVLEKYKISGIWKVLMAALAMLLYDFLLEIVAPKMGMWEWSGGVAPLRNYTAWLVLSLVFHGMIKVAAIRTENRLSVTVLSVQFVFFALLAIFL